MLQRGNKKLGSMFYTWSIPAKTTCPGASKTCIEHCYGTKGRFRTTRLGLALEKNLEVSKQDTFVSWMSTELLIKRVAALRIHVVGDFYSVEYAEKWLEILRNNKHRRALLYTRSWRIPEIVPVLRRMAALPNVNMWLSADNETGKPIAIRHTQVAYMSVDDNDGPKRANNRTLIFRTNRKTPLKKLNGMQVCPPENGVKTQVQITCTACQLCLYKNPNR